MAQRKRLSQNPSQNKRRSDAAEEDDDVTFTQPSLTQVQRGLEKLSGTELDQKTAEVVQFILVKDQKKIPVRRADLVKNVIKDYRNVYPEIIRRAAETLDQVFGLKLHEIDTKNHLYIVVNKLTPSPAPPQLQSPSRPKRGLLFIVLGVIFMNRGVVRETLIWNVLKKLRVDPSEKHQELGDVKKLLTDEFVRQKYLEHVKIPHTDPLEHEFRWGQRAEIELNKAKVLDFMAELHGQEPTSWSQQYREAHAAPAASQPSTSQQRRSNHQTPL